MTTTTSCARQNTAPTSNVPAQTDSMKLPPYAFDHPDALFRMPHELREISGLTVLDDRTLGAIQDEKGRLYLIDMATGEVEDNPRFDKDGDYEDLSRVGDRVFVLRSDGRLTEIKDWQADDLKTDEHKTKLSSKYDTEGLTYDAANDRLLIACKEYAGKNLKHHKAIYAFDLKSEEMSEEPVYTINIANVSETASSDAGPNALLRKAFGGALDLSGFKPSALAIHPITGDIYVLSSVLKVIVVLQANGAMTAVWPLSEHLFRQPEGMTFLPNGDLFISSEGDGKKGTVMRFNYHP